MNYFIVFRIYRLDTNGISTKIFEPLVVNFIIIFMLIPSIKKFVDPTCGKELKNPVSKYLVPVPGSWSGDGEKCID